MGGLKIATINFSRISNGEKILDIMEKLNFYAIDIYCIQEINIFSAIKFLKDRFHVIVNWDMDSKSNKPL